MKKNIRSFYQFTSFIKFLFCLMVLYCTFASHANAQTASSSSIGNTMRIATDDLNHKINIEFKSDQLIYNLLVLVTDSTGRTVFLENKYRFKGEYKQEVYLQTAEKGSYSVKIANDDEQLEKKIMLK